MMSVRRKDGSLYRDTVPESLRTKVGPHPPRLEVREVGNDIHCLLPALGVGCVLGWLIFWHLVILVLIWVGDGNVSDNVSVTFMLPSVAIEIPQATDALAVCLFAFSCILLSLLRLVHVVLGRTRLQFSSKGLRYRIWLAPRWRSIPVAELEELIVVPPGERDASGHRLIAQSDKIAATLSHGLTAEEARWLHDAICTRLDGR